MSAHPTTTPAEPVNHSCPYCSRRKVETVATAPYVRGFLVAFQVGSKTFLGCTPCVRKKVLGEAGLSSLIGWFSITSLVINPILITWNIAQSPFIRTNYLKVRQKLREAGIPEDSVEQVDITQMGYLLAAAMIAADGKVEASEIQAADELGKQLFPDFNTDEFRAILGEINRLPSHRDIASILGPILTEDGKKSIFLYLHAIANSDGDFDVSEQKLLTEVAINLGYHPEQQQAVA